MIPPLPAGLLESNPQFAALHKTLTTKILSPDASTKTTNQLYQPTEDQVSKLLTKTAKQRILSQALRNLALSDDDENTTPELPAELRELIYIISTYLLTTPTLTPSQATLLTAKIRHLQDRLPKITPLLSHSLSTQQSHLYTLSTTVNSTSTTNPPTHHPHYTLHLHLSHPLTQLTTLRTNLTTTHTHTTNTLLSLLTLSTTHLTAHLSHLSTHTHGLLTRHTLTHSTHTHTLSHTLSAKLTLLSLQTRRSTYHPTTQIALAKYASHLDELVLQLEGRVRMLEDEVRLYAECDGREGKVMEELARRYRDTLGEMEVVKGDVEKLEGGGGGQGEKGRNLKASSRSRRDWEVA